MPTAGYAEARGVSASVSSTIRSCSLLAHTWPLLTTWMHLHKISKGSSRERTPTAPEQNAWEIEALSTTSSTITTSVLENEDRISRAKPNPADRPSFRSALRTEMTGWWFASSVRASSDDKAVPTTAMG